MKKINIIMLSLILISGNLNASFLPQSNPLKFGRDNAAMEVKDLRSYGKANQMFRIMPGRAIQATDKNGDKLFLLPTGKLALSVSKDGTTSFQLNGSVVTKDKDGKVTGKTKNLMGTNLVEEVNEFGEVISYKEMDGGGKVYRTYDYQMNLTATYIYDQFGKTLSAITNELNKGQTIFDELGRAAYEIDFEGNRMMKYIYKDDGRVDSKVVVFGNTTHYADNGTMTYTENKNGIVLCSYNYGYDKDNNYVLLSSFDPTERKTTYYDKNRPTVVKNYAGAVTDEYIYTGSKLIASYNTQSQEMTWYDLGGKALYTSFHDELISKNIYYQGALIGIWNARNNQLTIVQKDRREVTVQLGDYGDPIIGEKDVIKEIGKDEDSHKWGKADAVLGFEAYDPGKEPTAEDILKWIAAGLLDHKYIGSPL
jgi:hypothetical protein